MASISSTYPMLFTAPKMTQRLFVCCHCGRLATRSARPLVHQKSFSKPPSLSFFRNSATAISSKADESVEGTSSLSLSSRKINKYQKEKHLSLDSNKNKTNESFFPEISHKTVAYWLLGSAASVFGIVVFGGLTRLTESGYALFNYCCCCCCVVVCG